MYHWLSTYTGEVIEDFPTLVSEIVSTVRYYRKHWTFFDIVRFVCCWKYSKAGF